MMRYVGTAIFVGLVILGLAGCSQESGIVSPDGPVQANSLAKVAGVTIPTTDNLPCTKDLIAGQHTVVGTVYVALDAGKQNLLVTYTVNAGWYLTEAHLDIESSLSAIPQVNGNPVPGQFPYAKTWPSSSGITTYTFTVPIPAGTPPAYVAAHAVVANGPDFCTVEDVCGALPSGNITISNWIEYPPNNPPTYGPAYYTITLSNAGVFNGTYLAWCANNNFQNAGYPTGKLVCSYDLTAAAGVVLHPENLDLVNYMLNKFYAGAYPSAAFPELQGAIWILLDGVNWTPPTGQINWNTSIANAMIADAVANGEGFKPTTGQKMIVLIDSGSRSTLQNVFIYVTLACGGEETAWGGSLSNPGNFGGKNWALFFKIAW